MFDERFPLCLDLDTRSLYSATINLGVTYLAKQGPTRANIDWGIGQLIDGRCAASLPDAIKGKLTARLTSLKLYRLGEKGRCLANLPSMRPDLVAPGTQLAYCEALSPYYCFVETAHSTLHMDSGEGDHLESWRTASLNA